MPVLPNTLGAEQVRLMPFIQNDMRAHTHDYLELVYIVRGQIRHTVNGTESTVAKGDFFIIDYDTPHSYTAIQDSSCQLINCLFLPSLIDPVLKNCRSFETLINNHLIHFSNNILKTNPANYVFHDDDGRISALFEALVEEYENKPYGYIELIRSKLIELLILTMRKIIREERTDYTDKTISQMLAYIHGHYDQDITLTQISRSLNYSLPYLSQKFKQTMGIPFIAYLQKVRIERSCWLLLNTSKPVSEIAALVGYRDLNFFHMIFKKCLDATPGEFRRAYQNRPAAGPV